MQQLIEECDKAILAQLETLSTRELDTPEASQSPEAKPEPAEPDAKPAAAAASPAPKKAPSVKDRRWQEQLRRIVGVDLTQLPGIGVLAVMILISEIGVDMSKWRNAKAFASWLGLCPNNKISGGRILSARSRRVVCRSADILRVAASTLGRSDTPLGAFYRRKKAQIGAPKATTATARKLACMVYQLIRDGQNYRPETAGAYESRFKTQTLSSLRKRASKLGYQLTELKEAA